MITTNIGGKLLRWHYDVGQMVEQGEVIADIETGESHAPLLAPASGRLTEMTALSGDTIEAGAVVGWIDELEADSDAPQPLSALIDAPERKPNLKRLKRKPRRVFRPATRLLVIGGLLAALGLGALMALLVMPVGSATVVVTQQQIIAVTAPPPPLQPTPRFRLQERVIFKDTTQELQWGTQGVVKESGYDPSYGTWYAVRFGDDLRRVSENQLDPVSVLAPTPTMRYEWSWSSGASPLKLREAVGEYPAGTIVTIASGYFNGTDWMLDVRTESEDILQVLESQLTPLQEVPVYPEATPTMRFDFRLWDWSRPLTLVEPVADFPAGTQVTITSSHYNGVEWELDVVTENGISLQVRETQLAFPLDAQISPSAAVTLTP